MGNPSNYSLELPYRCHRLLDELWDEAETIRDPQEPHLGPLTTTFLLAMATPMIVIPIERVDRYRRKQGWGYADERDLSPETAKEIDRVLGGRTIGEVEPSFFDVGAWRFASMDFDGERLSEGLPSELAEKLENPQSAMDAADLEGAAWASILRNALAHGGVLYLNEYGQSHWGKAEMFAFVSAKFPKFDPHEHPKGTPLYGKEDMSKPPSRLRVLRIGQDDFRSFLSRWVEWLQTTDLASVRAAA